MSYSTVLPIPKREEWFILTTLFTSDKPLNVGEVAERTAIDRDVVSLKLIQLNEKGLVRIARSDRLGRKEYQIGKEGLAILPSMKREDYRLIGEEAQDLALKFVKYAINQKWFVALGVQGQRERKPDLVSFDYEKNESIAVEIESTDHISHSHPEQVKQHMLEVDPFDRMVIVTRKGEPEEKAKTLLDQIIDETQKGRIEVISF
jgi:DNA-binding MarR family transcriptional regulator